MKFLTLCLLSCACVLPTAALAEWQWLDAQGKKVFSDQPPPLSVPEKNILKRPGQSGTSSAAAAPAPAPASTPAAAAAAAPTAPKASGVDKALEDKKRQAEDAEKAKEAADKQKQAAARAENCARAREGKATLDSGVRLARVNAQGEREIMDDNARAAEQRRVQTVLEQDCK